MRTVDPAIWSQAVRKRVPSSLATFLARKSRTSDVQLTSKEKVFRKSVKATFNEYLRHTTVPGMRAITDDTRSVVERVVLVMLGLVSLSTMVVRILYGVESVHERPVVVSLESYQYPAGNVMFPGVALCSANLISRRAAVNFTAHLMERLKRFPFRRRNRMPTELEVYEMVRRVGYLYDYQVAGIDQLRTLLQLMHRANYSFNDDIGYNLLKQLEPTCEDMLVRCSWSGAVVSCKELFHSRNTAYGHCCCFNYVRKHNARGEPYGVYEKPLKLANSGLGYGLSVIIKNDPDEFAYPKHNSIGTDVLIFNPLDFPDQSSGALSTHLTLANRTVYLDVSSITQYSTEKVRMWDLNSRGCRFQEELARFNGHYSYSGCVTNCRLRTAYSLCSCAPFASPTAGYLTKCGFEDIACLKKHKEKFLYMYPGESNTDGLQEETQNSLFCPECYPDCESVRYTVKSFFTGNKERNFTHKTNFTYGIDLTNMSVIHAYYSSDDHLLFKMDVLYDWFELVGFTGCMICLFLGVSILSVLELLYFCCHRFFVIWSRNKKKYLIN